MKQEPLKRRRPAARKRGQKQTLQAVVLSVLAVSVIALCLGIWTRLPGEDVPVGGVERRRMRYPLLHPLRPPEPEPEPQPVVETIRFSATGDNLIHSPIYNQPPAGQAKTESTALITAMSTSLLSMRNRTGELDQIRRPFAATPLHPPPTMLSTPGDCAPGAVP